MGIIKKPLISLFSLNEKRVTLKDGTELIKIEKDTTISNILYRTKINGGI